MKPSYVIITSEHPEIWRPWLRPDGTLHAYDTLNQAVKVADSLYQAWHCDAWKIVCLDLVSVVATYPASTPAPRGWREAEAGGTG